MLNLFKVCIGVQEVGRLVYQVGSEANRVLRMLIRIGQINETNILTAVLWMAAYSDSDTSSAPAKLTVTLRSFSFFDAEDSLKMGKARAIALVRA